MNFDHLEFVNLNVIILYSFNIYGHFKSNKIKNAANITKIPTSKYRGHHMCLDGRLVAAADEMWRLCGDW